jgi:acyl-CoA reductase-like NAD-dependent aldehyde dehydrogenase
VSERSSDTFQKLIVSLSTMGPLIHERAVAKCQEHVDDAVKRGAKVLIGGTGAHGCYFPPTILGDAPNDCVSGAGDCPDIFLTLHLSS